jgi:hypothetical protein
MNLGIEFRKTSSFNWRVILIKLFGRYEWWGEPGGEMSGYVKKLGNWVFVVPDKQADEARRKFNERL